jgi:hypothetical protein
VPSARTGTGYPSKAFGNSMNTASGAVAGAATSNKGEGDVVSGTPAARPPQ